MDAVFVLALACVCIGLPVALWLVGLVRTLSRPRRRFVRLDGHDARKRAISHAGFKSRQGIRERRCV